jgi:hypothetical protein
MDGREHTIRPLYAKWYNPRYRAGIRHCFGALCGAGKVWSQTTFRFDGEEYWIESDMWDVARKLVEMDRRERDALGWTDLYARAVLQDEEESA